MIQNAEQAARRRDHTHLGSPAHFAAFVRTADAARGSGVITVLRVEGFIVPEDGIWMINGKWLEAGTELTIEPGSTVKYHATGVDMTVQGDDPRFRRQAACGPLAPALQVQGSRAYDPREGKILPVTTSVLDALPAAAAARGERRRAAEAELPSFARKGRLGRGGLILPD